MPMYPCICTPYAPGTPVDCGIPGISDAGGVLELQLLNVQMGMMGVYAGCGLIFYTYSIAYSVTFGPAGAFQIQQFNKHLGEWDMNMFSGVLYQTTDALNSYGPFLPLDQIPVFWNNVSLPPVIGR